MIFSGVSRCERFGGCALLSFVAATVFCTRSASAAEWNVFVAPQITVPINLMRSYYALSPTIAGGFGIERKPVSVRLSVSFTPLRSAVSSLVDTAQFLDDPATPGVYDRKWFTKSEIGGLGVTVRHVSLAAEIVMREAFGIPPLSLVGGVGVGYRKLNEGRQFEITLPGENETRIPTRVRRGVGKSAVDLIARVGFDVRLWETGAWSLMGETVYQASFAALNPRDVALDLRVDELIQTGLIFVFETGGGRK